MGEGTAFRLQELTAGHAPAYAGVLAELHGEAFAAAPWGPEAMAGALGQPGAYGVVALGDGDEPLGFVVMRVAVDEAEVLTIATRPACRRRGVARALMDAALDRARALGAARVFLEVAETNAPARALYGRLGFQEVGRRKAYYARPGRENKGGAREDALVLARDL